MPLDEDDTETGIAMFASIVCKEEGTYTWKKYSIKGLPENHIAQVDFNEWMTKKVCSKCGYEGKNRTAYYEECAKCHSREPFIERWKYYESKK